MTMIKVVLIGENAGREIVDNIINGINKVYNGIRNDEFLSKDKFTMSYERHITDPESMDKYIAMQKESELIGNVLLDFIEENGNITLAINMDENSVVLYGGLKHFEDYEYSSMVNTILLRAAGQVITVDDIEVFLRKLGFGKKISIGEQEFNISGYADTDGEVRIVNYDSGLNTKMISKFSEAYVKGEARLV